MKRRRWRRWLALALATLLLCGCLAGRPAFLWVRAWLHDQPVPHHVPMGHVDDASRMNSTPVATVWSIPSDPAGVEEQLRELLQRARMERLPVALAGARHTMGGHTIAPDGIVLNMLPFNHMAWDAQRELLTVGAGARWFEIIPYLDARGLSVAIMQSNHNFSVGGSLSVNCHGWQQQRPPIASTVASFRLMLADGTIVRCSRTEQTELFALVLGGYGLFGIILDAELRVVPNERYRPEVEVLPAERYVARFQEKVGQANDVGMVYGRLCVAPGAETFLREAILTVFRQSPCRPEEMPTLRSPGYATLRREVYRAQIGSAAGKDVRWKTEKAVSGIMGRMHFSRNQLLHEPAEVFQEQNADRTDILHEYFLPPEGVGPFLDAARQIIPRHDVDLLNVTIRNVLADQDSFLRYADRDLFAFVMLFNQPRTSAADERMAALTRELIDAALANGGRFYLPYRLHATPEQLAGAYPQAARFFERKRHYDPHELFQNQFYLKYGRP